MLTSIKRQLKQQTPINTIAKHHGIQWSTVKKISLTGQLPVGRGHHTNNTGGKHNKIRYAIRRRIALAVGTALRNQKPISQVAKKYGVAWITCKDFYETITGKTLPKSKPKAARTIQMAAG
jgi:hypothetical protein